MTARDYLISLELFGIKLGLEQIRGLVAALDHPDRAFPSLIVAGTNGKGSTAAMIERGLRAAGYRTGRYTSPHLVDIEERFCVDGRPISGATFDRLAARVREAAATLPAPPSFFEATTALALDLFREARVDVAVLEVGLGGRLDATNVVTPIAGAITSIDFDHEQYLGHTLAAIAAEKAGVIKSDMLIAVADNVAEVDDVIAAAARAHHAELVRATDVVVEHATLGPDGRMTATLTTAQRRHDGVTLALRGRHQLANATTAAALLDALDARGRLRVPAAAVRTGLADAVWPARLELLQTAAGPILIDGAHNPAGAAKLAS
ncbi:MAG TPA: Mur ligase family protein, partial [Vicinamibacterales bacterium]|nr:Mur ligase family protein [Vicinamibacterales bacterium]